MAAKTIEVTLEDNIPIPKRDVYGKWAVAIAKLGLWQSFTVKGYRDKQAATMACRRLGFKVTSRNLSDDVNGEYRIWRIG